VGCYVIAEVGQAHDGSLGTAHAYIDAAARAGADAVKFQTHIAAAESTLAEPWRTRFSQQDETRYGYWRRMEFTEEQWLGLRRHADDLDLDFWSSAFSSEAVDLLRRVGVAGWKVASGEISNLPLLRHMLEDGLPVVLSSGMSSIEELDRAVDLVRNRTVDLTLLQCTSAYPCPPEKVGLNVIDELRRRYDCPVGLSDHSGTIYAGLAAVARGAQMLEVHVTLSRDAFGPDVPASVTTEELGRLVDGIRFIETALANPVDKAGMAAELTPLRALFTKSAVACRPIPRGTQLTAEHLVFKKPGTGISPEAAEGLYGRVTVRDLTADEILGWDDVEVEA
jgi:N,N'-diacetyllegionaminate synthase